MREAKSEGHRIQALRNRVALIFELKEESHASKHFAWRAMMFSVRRVPQLAPFL